ncbi:MAG: tryptophan 7-halogenase [Rhodobacteraceae bacterium]|nr:tryptophan 7-halogenase [Paracoccaceae bacterium]
MQEQYDVVILGTGPAGATAAAYLAKEGLSVLAVEKDDFPRFHIGESLTGSAGLVVRELGLEAAMAELDYPKKPGVTVIGHQAKNEFFVPVMEQTWQVRRSTFDALLRDRAIENGMELLSARALKVERDGDVVTGLRVAPAGGGAERMIGCRMFIDASGQAAFLSAQGVAGPRRGDAFNGQMAFFSHYEDVPRDPGPFANNTTLFYSELHHWAWMIPISSTVDSFGVVLPKETYKQVASSPEEALAWGIANINPEIAGRFSKAHRVEKVRAFREYSYRIDPFVGPNWACLGDAHRFLDPIFSYGVSFAMMEARQIALKMTACWNDADLEEPLRDFAKWSDTGQNIAHDLIKYFWKFPVFFGYQMQNVALRNEVIQLFGGACFHPEAMRVPALFREALGEESAQIVRPPASQQPMALSA